MNEMVEEEKGEVQVVGGGGGGIIYNFVSHLPTSLPGQPKHFI